MPGSPSPGTSRQRSRNASLERRGAARARRTPPELLRRIALVAGLERRVRGEDDVLADLLERLVERHALRRRAQRALERGQRGMALVQVHDVRPDAERLEHTGAADAEQAVLREPDVRVAVVGARRRPAATGSFSGSSASSMSSDTLPTCTHQTWNAISRPKIVTDELQRLAVAAVDERHRQLVRVVVEPVLLLRPGQVEPLNEVAAAVEEPDADHLQAAVARLLEHVARQHAEPARVARAATRGRRTRPRSRRRSRRTAAPGDRRRAGGDSSSLREPVDALDDARARPRPPAGGRSSARRGT